MARPSSEERGAGAAVAEDGSSPLRVAFLIHDLRPGGAEQVFLTYVNGAEALAPLAVVVRRHPGLEADLADAVPLFDLGSSEVAAVPRPMDPPPPTRAGGPALLGPAMLVVKALRLRRILEARGADAVSTFLHKSHAIALFLKLFVWRELRVVVNVHELPTQHIPLHFGPVGRLLMAGFTRVALPRADLVVAVADGVRDDLVERHGVPRDRVVVVGNPVPKERIEEGGRAPVEHPFLAPGAGPVVVGVGRLVPLKGFDVLLDALAALPTELGVRLVLVGDGPERDPLRERARALGVAESVSLVGYDPNPWRYVARADALVLSSRTEALPSVVGEALVLGVPVVATDCSPGVTELLGDDAAGLRVPPDDAAALSEALRRVVTDAALRARLAEGARLRGRALPGPEQVGTYERTLLEVLRPGAGAR